MTEFACCGCDHFGSSCFVNLLSREVFKGIVEANDPVGESDGHAVNPILYLPVIRFRNQVNLA